MISQSDNNKRIVNLMQQRDTYFDFLRGIAIIMVMGIHTYTDGLMHFNLFLRQFLNCAVPIFLAISGYFIGHKSFAEQGSYVRFLKKQVPRVHIPMLLWSIPWMLLAIRGGESPLVSIFRTFVGDMSIFYFIILIIQYYALTPLIQRANRKSGEALIFGNCVPMPLMIKVTRANPAPNSDNCIINEEWF